MQSNLQTWQTFLAHSLVERIDEETFTEYTKILNTRCPLSGVMICDLFLSPQDARGGEHGALVYTQSPDLRVVRYIQCLLAEGLVTIPGILRALWRVSTFRTLAEDAGGDNHAKKKDRAGGKNGKETQTRKRWINSYETEETLFYRLTKHVASGSSPKDVQEITELILVCIQWMSLVVSLSAETTSMLHPTQTQEIAAQNMALGTFVIALVENAKVQRALRKGSVTKATRKELEKTLGAFITLLMQSSPQIAARLEIFRRETLVALLPVDAKEKNKDAERGGAEKEMDDILEGGLGMSLGLESMVVEDIPSMNTRAGLYVYLNSLVSVLNEVGH